MTDVNDSGVDAKGFDTTALLNAAQAALAPKADDNTSPAADLTTTGTTKATKIAAGAVAVFGVVGPTVVAFLNKFETHETLGVAAGAVVAAGLLAIAWVIGADYKSRAAVAAARMAGLAAMAEAALVIQPSALACVADGGGTSGSTAATLASTTAEHDSSLTNGVPVVGFDVCTHGEQCHLLAVAWPTATSTSAASPDPIYLVAKEGKSGPPSWKPQTEIDGVLRVKLEKPHT